jgi:hypothetical protein
MAVVKISDILTPDVWNAYGAQRTAELSAFWSSGIVASMDGITLPNGGGTINIPHFGDLTGDAEVLSDSAALTPGNITAAKQVAAIIGRGRAWGANDLATVFAGADPAAAILDRVAEYWSRQMRAELIQILSGVFAAASMSGLISDISAGASETVRAFNASTFIDATQLLGDAKSNVSAVAMHSATEAYLAKQQLIVYETTAGKSDRISYYLGKRIIVDDGLPVAAGTYTSYIFGAGAVGYAEGVVGASDIENDRDILAGENVFTMRRRFILHPRGIKWQGTPAGDFPTRTALATGTNWVRVFDAKQIPIVQFKHKLA